MLVSKVGAAQGGWAADPTVSVKMFMWEFELTEKEGLIYWDQQMWGRRDSSRAYVS